MEKRGSKWFGRRETQELFAERVYCLQDATHRHPGTDMTLNSFSQTSDCASTAEV